MFISLSKKSLEQRFFSYLWYVYLSLCTRDNRCQGPFTCCRQLPGYDIGCVCSFTCLPNVGRTNPGNLGMFPVYSLTIWEWRLSLWPGRILSDICRTILRVKSDKTLCPTWEYEPRSFHLLQTVAGLRYRVRLLFYVFAKCRANEPR
jgi:hypothetical protein